MTELWGILKQVFQAVSQARATTGSNVHVHRENICIDGKRMGSNFEFSITLPGIRDRDQTVQAVEELLRGDMVKGTITQSTWSNPGGDVVAWNIEVKVPTSRR